MKLALDIYQDITPQVQLNIEFPQIKSKMPHTSQSITSSVKISLQNQTFERTQNDNSKICVYSVNNVASGFLLEDFGAYYSNLSLDISLQKDYLTDLLVTQVRIDNISLRTQASYDFATIHLEEESIYRSILLQGKKVKFSSSLNKVTLHCFF